MELLGCDPGSQAREIREFAFGFYVLVFLQLRFLAAFPCPELGVPYGKTLWSSPEHTEVCVRLVASVVFPLRVSSLQDQPTSEVARCTLIRPVCLSFYFLLRLRACSKSKKEIYSVVCESVMLFCSDRRVLWKCNVSY